MSLFIEAINLCATIEPLLRARGWHVALTGSVLYGHYSKAPLDAETVVEDIDLIFYPHRDDKEHNETIEDLLELIGAKKYEPCGGDQYEDSGQVYSWKLKSGTRVNAWITVYEI